MSDLHKWILDEVSKAQMRNNVFISCSDEDVNMLMSYAIHLTEGQMKELINDLFAKPHDIT